MTFFDSLVVSPPIQTYFVDKTTGAPLSAGVVAFYEDENRTVLKPIYQITESPPGNYSYSQLNNPVTLSSVGTFADNNGNDINVFLYPYFGTPFDIEQGIEELYYVTVYSSGLVLQETRSAWPPNSQGGGGNESGFDESFNQVINSQFVSVLFGGATIYSVTGTQSTLVAPGWYVLTTGTGTFTVTQVPIALGADVTETNPPYALQIASTGVTTISLYQQMDASPLLFAGLSVSGSVSVASLGGSTGQLVTVNYVPSSGNMTQLASGVTAASGLFASIEGSKNIPIDNADAAPGGYVRFMITLQPSVTFQVTSAQMVRVAELASPVEYLQESTPQQINGLFNFYNEPLQYKQIPSYLVGWDFPLNPVQFLGSTVAASAIGANKSKYVWDQTIIFQSADSGVGVTRGTAGELLLTAAAATQMAVIQYLPQTMARKVLNSPACVHLSAKTSAALGVKTTVSLWYTADVSLPVITDATNNSLVLTLDANGKPATLNGTWLEVPNLNNTQIATIATSSTTNFNDYALSGWDLSGIAGVNTATFFAIVAGTASVAISETIGINSISLQAGDIATRPAPQTQDEVFRECQYYYQKSFNQNVVPANNTGTTAGVYYDVQSVAGSNAGYIAVRFTVPMRVTPVSQPITYNPSAGTTGRIFNYSTGAVYASTQLSAGSLSVSGFVLTGTSDAGGGAGNLIGVNWTADARLGII